MRRNLAAVVTTLFTVTASAWAGERPPSASPAAWTPPQIQAVSVSQPPVIDGKLDDACWATAARLEGFFVPSVARAVPEETVGLICVGSKAIYVGVTCRDRAPEGIRATETRRGGEVGSDDSVFIVLDPWHQHRDTYSFGVNARGTQAESIPGGSAAKIEWRGDWSAAAVRTAEGWTAELAIPFSILRYPPGQSTFGFVLERWFPRQQVEAVYPVMGGRSYNSLQAADLVGLHPPPIRPRPILMPYLTAGLGEGTRRFDTGLDVQYKLPNGLTALGSLNPDYSQIEQVVEPISFSYTERYLPEVRPFFMTGADAYFPSVRSFYSRRLQDFDLGVKVFGTIGGNTYGLLDATTYGVENSLVGAWRHQFTADAYARMLLVSHTRAGEPSDLLYGVETSQTWRRPEGWDNLWSVLYQAGSYELGGGRGRGANQLGWSWRLARVEPDYQPALGYAVDQNTQGGEFNLNWWNQYEKSGLQDRAWSLSLSHYPYLDGGIYSSGVGATYDWEWRNGRLLEICAASGEDHKQRSSDVNLTLGWNWRSLYHRGHIFALRGTQDGGDYTWMSAGQGFRPRKHLSVEVSGQYVSLAPPSPDAYHAYQAVLTASYDLTTEKSLAARFIAQDGGVNVFAAYRQVVRRGMDAYLLLGDPDPGHKGFTTRVAGKLIWAF
jgi:hypothetical protein